MWYTGDMKNQAEHKKPVIDRHKTYLALIRNAVGSNLFRNLYVKDEHGSRDILEGGDLSCAVFVSSILTLVGGKIDRPHATVSSTVQAMKDVGWSPVPTSDVQPGDVIVWEPITDPDGIEHPHIGFSLGGSRAVSTSSTERTPVEHDASYGGKRKIVEVLRAVWED